MVVGDYIAVFADDDARTRCLLRLHLHRLVGHSEEILEQVGVALIAALLLVHCLYVYNAVDALFCRRGKLRWSCRCEVCGHIGRKLDCARERVACHTARKSEGEHDGH